jgi:hypothetical protein
VLPSDLTVDQYQLVDMISAFTNGPYALGVHFAARRGGSGCPCTSCLGRCFVFLSKPHRQKLCRFGAGVVRGHVIAFRLARCCENDKKNTRENMCFQFVSLKAKFLAEKKGLLALENEIFRPPTSSKK